MADTRSTMSALLKSFYLPGLRNTLNNELMLLAQVSQNSEKVEGLEVVQAVRLNRNQGIGARAEGGTLPTAGQSKVRNVRSWLKYQYGSLQFSGPLLRSATSDTGSFARPIETETKGVVLDLKNDVNRQLYGDGTGAIAAATGANTTTSVPVTLTTTQYLQLQPGMVVDIGPTPTGTFKDTNRTIVTASKTAVVLDAAPASATAATDRFFRAGNRGNELTGLSAMVNNSGLYFNIDPANDPEWASPVLNLGTSITEAAYGSVWKGVHLRTGEQPDLVVTSVGIHQDTANLLTGLKRFPSTNQLLGGYTGIDLGFSSQGKQANKTVTLLYDKDCPASTVFVLSTGRLEWQRASDWEFMQEDGNMLDRVPQQDAYSATLFCYADLVTDNRAAHGKIINVTEPAVQPTTSFLGVDEDAGSPSDPEADPEAHAKAKK